MDIWEDESPAMTLIRAQYREDGVHQWSNDRVGRLCQKLRCTVYELCAIAGVFEKHRARKFWGNKKWPTEVALHFNRLESFIHEREFNKAQPPTADATMSALLISRALQNPPSA